MKTPLACLNLLHKKITTLVATAGVAFALTLVFMQLGFLGSVVNTATLVSDQLDFDVAIIARDYQQFADSGAFPLERLYEARSTPGVADAIPLLIGLQAWRCEPQPDPSRGQGRAKDDRTDGVKQRFLLVLGLPLDHSVFRRDQTGLAFPIQVPADALDRLRRPDTLLIDAKSHPNFAPRTVGSTAEVGGRRLRVAGQFTLGISFAADGMMLVSEATFRSLFPGQPPDSVQLGLVKLEPGERGRADKVAQRIRSALTPPGGAASDPRGRSDVLVLGRNEYLRREVGYWLYQKSIGLIFLFGVAVALIVGLVVVYQVLSSDILEHIREYATLKAMGYTNRFLGTVVLQEALLLALLGYFPALGAAYLLYWWTRNQVELPIAMTGARAGMVLAMSALMCAGAGLLSIRKVTSSDPANLF